MLAQAFFLLTVLLTGCTRYGNPDNCKVVRTEESLGTEERALQLYHYYPECFSYGRNAESWFVKCCEDPGVKYHERTGSPPT